MSEDYVFRRVRGRIVPIKINKKKAEGGATIAGGLAIAGASAIAAAKAVKKSAEIRTMETTVFRGLKKEQALRAAGQQSFKFMANYDVVGRMKQAVKKRSFAAKLFKSRNLILGAGAFLGGSLISRGINKLQEKESSLPMDVLEDIGSYGVALGTASLYYGGLGVGPATALTKALRRVKGLGRGPHIPIRHKYGTLRFPGL